MVPAHQNSLQRKSKEIQIKKERTGPFEIHTRCPNRKFRLLGCIERLEIQNLEGFLSLVRRADLPVSRKPVSCEPVSCESLHQFILSPRTWLFRAWLFATFTRRRSLALICALSRPVVLFRVDAFALFCALSRSSECFCNPDLPFLAFFVFPCLGALFCKDFCPKLQEIRYFELKKQGKPAKKCRIPCSEAQKTRIAMQK